MSEERPEPPGPVDTLLGEDPGVELRRLAAATRSYLQWLSDQGVGWVPGGGVARRGGAVARSSSGRGPRQSQGDAHAAGAARREPSPAVRAPALAPGAAEAAGPAPTPPGVTPALRDVPAGSKGLALVKETLGNCTRCRLASGRIQLVFGDGNPEAALMFVGEAPGRDEDLAGEPFVGAAGALLTKMIAAMGFGRDEVYIANVLKCRPPRNRDPEPDEVACCLPFVRAQILAIRPRVIVTLGRYAAQALLDTDAPVGRLRGRFHSLTIGDLEIPVMPTYHPAYLLRNADAKRPVWEDLKQVIAHLRTLGIPEG